MQTEPTFNLGCLSAEQGWQLFEHYAFDGVEQNRDPKLVEIGKQIMNKCGMLPLAVKSIASLLRLEVEEESWRDILENELWESDASNEIFPPLQISYKHLPTYLKSCFLYCFMFPKDHCYDVQYMVKLWMYQGFIEPKGNKTAEKIGFEYAHQLCQRSLFEGEGKYEGNDFVFREFKLHDIIHDLARLNSENGCYSSEVSKLTIFPNVLYHLYIPRSLNLIDPIPSDMFTTLRTLIIGFSFKNFFSVFDLSRTPKLRALEIRGPPNCELEYLSSIGNLKQLRYLSLRALFFETLPECICSLYSLQNLTLRHSILKELPTKIGDLISLEELIIDKYFFMAILPKSICQLRSLRKLCISYCYKLKELPSDMGSLTNLQQLEIINTSVSYLPASLRKFVGIGALKVELICETIEWLKDFPDLGGALCIGGLKNTPNLRDVESANLVSMRNLEHLILSWNWVNRYWGIDGSLLMLNIKSGKNIFLEDQSCFPVMVSLQPHPNLSKLQIHGITLPEWIGSLCKLKYLSISSCTSLQFLKAESLPLELEELEIIECNQLVSMPGILKLKSLSKLSIVKCQNLCSFIMEPALELTMGAQEGSFVNALLGLTNLASLRSCRISNCFNLHLLGDELLPVEPCNVEVYNCPGLREWCLQHGINYESNLF
ncbi:disease resistance protein RGA2-like [Carex rostrata]